MSLEASIAELNGNMKALIDLIGKQINALGAPAPLFVDRAPVTATEVAAATDPATIARAAARGDSVVKKTPPPPAKTESSDVGSTQPPAGATGPLDYEKDVKPLALRAIALGQKDAAKKQAYTDLLAKIGAPSAKAMPAEHYPAFVAGLKEIVS